MTMVTIINVLAVKPGRMDEFIALQRTFAVDRAGGRSGLVGGRMYRNKEDSQAVLISQFESAEAQSAILGSDAFKAHVAKLRDVVESSSPNLYEAAYTYGAFQ